MSQLLKLIKKLEGKRLSNEVYLKERAVGNAAEKYAIPKEDQYLWDLVLRSRDFNDITIAGYEGGCKGGYVGGDYTDYGFGPTRLVSKASYDLMLFSFTKNVHLANWLATSVQLNSIMEDMTKRLPFDRRNAFTPREYDAHIIFAAGNIPKVNVYFDGATMNVKKHGMQYTGDVALCIKKDLGQGAKCGLEMTTQEALFGKDPTERKPYNTFQNQVLRSKEQLSSFADTFKMHPAYKTWVLVVDNI